MIVYVNHYGWECKTNIFRASTSQNLHYTSGKRNFFEKVSDLDFWPQKAVLCIFCTYGAEK